MDFFKSVFSEDPEPSDSHNTHKSPSNSPRTPTQLVEDEYEPNPNPNSSTVGSAWSFGGLIKTLASKSESVIQTYRRDLEEFGSELKKETATIREVASRAVKELPVSIEAGASVAQESLESVGQAIDDFGTSVWRGTAEIVSQGKDSLLAADLDSDSSDNYNQQFSNQSLNSKPYSRFDAQVRAIQCDLNTYCEEPEDLDDYNNWKSGFVIDEKTVEIESLFEENGAMEGIYRKLVPNTTDSESFWSLYFYRVYKLKRVEDARASLVKRVISGEEEEDLSWDVDDDDEESNGFEPKGVSAGNRELGEKDGEFAMEHKNVENSEVETGEEISKSENEDRGVIAESISDNGAAEKVALEGRLDLSESNGDKLEEKCDDKIVMEGKTDNGESCKDSDVSVVSTQPSLPEEEDLGWDEIEDIGSNDENKVAAGGSPNRGDLRKRLSTAEEEEDLSWDIEDDDEPVKS